MLVTIPSRFCGPPGTGNGGWVAGTLATVLDTDAAQVTLRAPAPLDTALVVDRDDAGTRAWLFHDGNVVAEAVAASPLVVPPPFVPVDVAAATAARFPAGPPDHPFPGCFVCGPDRAPGDGLRVLSGPIPGRPGVVAAVFTPPAWLAGPDGAVRTEAVWAALDCPSAWPFLGDGAAAVLGRITARVGGPVVAERTYVVVGRADRADGRKRFGTSALYDAGGALVATASATWIEIAVDTAA
jgi:hypothetical protein